MGVKKIDRLKAFAPDLRIKVNPSRHETPILENREHAASRQVDIRGELVGVPAKQQVASVGIDGAQETLASSVFKLMFHRMAGESRVVGLDVQLDMILEAIASYEVDAIGGIKIILVLCGLLGFRFEEELPIKTNLLGVGHREVHKGRKVIDLSLEVGIVEVLVAFPASPENVIFSPKLLGNLDRLLHLGACIGEGICVAAGGCSMNIARVAEEICRPPQQLDPRPLLLFLQESHNLVKVGV